MPAVIALVHVASESSGPAITDIVECPPLVWGENMSPVLQELLLVSAEYIGHLEPMRCHPSTAMVEAALTTSNGLSRSIGLFALSAAESTTCK